MLKTVLPLTAIFALAVAQADECPSDDDTPTPSSVDPGADFDRYCQGRNWSTTTVDVVEGQLSGESVGAYTMLSTGDIETMKFVPAHPFYVTQLRIQFMGGSGPARLRMMRDYGRSQPDVYSGEGDLIEPITIDVSAAQAGKWIEVDISGQGLFLHPTQHYFLVYEHLAAQPYLMAETVPSGETSRALLELDGDWYGVGDDNGSYNYRMELKGEHFCKWSDADRWFHETTDAPWADVRSQRATLADVNGDTFDDLIVNDGSPHLYLNQGAGFFAPPPFEPWPAAWYMSVMAFADLDNDGDVDAVGLSYVSPDNDGDGYLAGKGGDDCNDANVDIYPGALEVENGLDDDCDGVADDGTDTVDDDGDGFSEAAGDCDDTMDTVYPGAAEIPDHLDNDCDHRSEEDLVNKVFLNNGQGLFSAIPARAVEQTEPATVAAFGDANGDGVLDLYYGNWLLHYPDNPAVMDRFFIGQGDGTFVERTQLAGMTSETQQGGLPCYGVVWADYNNDGALDIYVSNYGYGHNLLYENHGGTFTEVGMEKGVSHDPTTDTPLYAIYGGNTFGADWGDFDNDGDLDLFATNIAHPRYQPWSDISQFLENGGAPDFLFTDIREEAGIHYDEGDVNVSFVDFNRDGWLDLMVTSLYPEHYATLYRNEGDGSFTDVTYEAGIDVRDSVSNVWTDVDHDGDLDVVVADREGPSYVHLYLNDENNANTWVELTLEGTSTNRSAVGARVSLTADGLTRIQEVKGGGGHSGNQSSLTVYFGLGSATSIDTVEVRWSGGTTEAISGIEPGGRYRIVEGQGPAQPL